jgi:hypothetical protein
MHRRLILIEGSYSALKVISCSVIIITFLTGCASPFLEKEFIIQKDLFPNSSGIIYYENIVDFTDISDVRVYERTLVKIGSASKIIPGLLNVTDNSIMQLVSYNARITHRQKTKESFSKKHLNKYNLSSSYNISSSSVYFLPVEQITKPGDIIETITEYKYRLPQLGYLFSQPKNMVPGSEFSYAALVPDGYRIGYKETNSGINKTDVEKDQGKYLFKGTAEHYNQQVNPFAIKESSPGVLITYPVKSGGEENFTWIDFGDWYADLFESKTRPDPELKNTVSAIIAGLNSDLLKLEAIFNYCQQKIRYEQVYPDLGEFIPNHCSITLERGYGDCKDYSALIYTMAKAAGIKTSPALCLRGRGVKSFENIPVSQFNHIIIYFRTDDNEYWLDGTNRSGSFGVTTSDLINQEALIIEKGNSRLKQIKNSESNLLKITGSLLPSGTDLTGELTFTLSGQYAVDFFYYDYMLNRKDMRDYLLEWISRYVSSKIIVMKADSERDKENFKIRVKCTLSNSIVKIDSFYYCSIMQVFPSLIPQMGGTYKEEEIFYYPKRSSIEMDIKIPGLADYNLDTEGFSIKHLWSFDPGPYSETSRKEFLQHFRLVQESLTKKYKLIQRDI